VILTLEPVTFRLRAPLRTARDALAARTALRVRARHDGREGVGDAAALPWFGTETAEAARRALEDAAARWAGSDPETALAGLDAADTPCARAALETALLGVLGQAPADRLGLPAAAQVRCSALVTGAEDAAEAAARGAQVLKLKVGGRALAEDRARLEAICAAAPRASLRLDANGAWTRAEAWAALAALTHPAVELCEQPVAAADLDGLLALAREGPVPIAADESLLVPGAIDRLIAPGTPLAAVVLKPTALGGPLRACALGLRARSLGIAAVVTTLLDGPVMQAMARGVAAAVDPDARSHHGIDTHRLFLPDDGRA
jgi:o-succinylbenzoate synthase